MPRFTNKEIPDYTQTETTGLQILQKYFPEIDINNPNNYAVVLNRSLSAMVYQLLVAQQDLIKKNSKLDADLDYLGEEILNEPRLEASKSKGVLVFSGVLGTIIPAGSRFINGDFATIEDVGVENYNVSIKATIDNKIVTASGANSLPTGFKLRVRFGGTTKTGVVTNGTPTFLRIELDDSLNTVIEDTVQLIYNAAFALCESVNTGLDKNISASRMFSTNFAVEGLEKNGFVSAYGFTGGADLESDDRYRLRLFNLRTNYPASSSPSGIVAKILREHKEVTDVYIVRTSKPPVNDSDANLQQARGHATIFPLYRNRSVLNPSSQDIDDIKLTLEKVLPPGLNIDDFHVGGVKAKVITVGTPEVIKPSTPLMPPAISKAIKQYFRDKMIPGKAFVKRELIDYLLANVKDSNGARLESITIDTGTSDTVLGNREIGVLSAEGYEDAEDL